jgi:hypothetical protein
MASSIERRIMLIEKFVQAKRASKKDPTTMVAICQALLQEASLEEAIRAGDCLAMLVEYYHGAKQMNEAYNYLQEMESRRIQLHPYLDAEVSGTRGVAGSCWFVYMYRGDLLDRQQLYAVLRIVFFP